MIEHGTCDVDNVNIRCLYDKGDCCDESLIDDGNNHSNDIFIPFSDANFLTVLVVIENSSKCNDRRASSEILCYTFYWISYQWWQEILKGHDVVSIHRLFKYFRQYT